MRNSIFIALLLAFVFIAGCTTPAPEAQANNSTTQAVPAANATANSTQDTGAMEIPANASENLSANASEQNFSIDLHKVYSDDGKLIVYYFYSHTCPKCKAIEPFVESIAKHYANVTQWQSFDINNKDDRATYFRFFKEFNLTQNRSGVPAILVNNTVLWGRFEINDSLEQEINGSLAPSGRQ